MPIASAFYAVVFLILGYHAVVHLLKVDPIVSCCLGSKSYHESSVLTGILCQFRLHLLSTSDSAWS